MKKDIEPGAVYGRLTVINKTDQKKHACFLYKCRCECGKEVIVRSDYLKTGETKSCGCIHDELFRKNVKKAYENNFIEGTSIPKIKDNKLQKNNSSGITGVYWHKKIGKWMARISFKGKAYSLGYYDDIRNAAEARKEAEKELIGPFLEWYEKEYKK